MDIKRQIQRTAFRSYKNRPFYHRAPRYIQCISIFYVDLPRLIGIALPLMVVLGFCPITVLASHFELAASGTITREVDVLDQRMKEFAKNNPRPSFKKLIQPFDSGVYDFDVFVRDCRWRIRLIERGEDGAPGLVTIDAGSDGVDTYVVYVYSRALLETAVPNVPPTKPINNVVAQIRKGAVLTEEPVASIVWLAYCSTCYFDSLHTNKIIPVYLATPPGKLLPQEYLCRRAVWETISQDMKIPRMLHYYEDGVIHQETDGSIKLLKIDPPFDNGYVMAAYQVLNTTNTLGSTVPSDFSFQTFVPRYPDPKSAQDTTITLQLHGKLSNLSETNNLADADFIPPLRGTAAIADHRFVADGVPLVGYITNRWIAEDSVKDSSAYPIWSRLANSATVKSQKPRVTFYLFFVLVNSVAVALLLWGRHRTSGDTPDNQQK